ncbi:MAG: hypothetical protein ABFS19_05475 [Thermodesulfobacteriota bacterium]
MRTKIGLAGRVRKTWLPHTDRVPVYREEEFISRLVEKYVEKFPPDKEGYIHLDMTRLEVEAEKIA